jgi:hypothetical protein
VATEGREAGGIREYRNDGMMGPEIFTCHVMLPNLPTLHYSSTPVFHHSNTPLLRKRFAEAWESKIAMNRENS